MDDDTGRRSFLRALGAATLAGVAGCIERATPAADPPTPTVDRESLDETAAATFRGGLQNRGFYPEKSVPEAVEVEWTIEAMNTGDHTAAKSSCVLAPDGNLIWPGDTGQVHSVATDGTIEWIAETDVTPDQRGIHGTPTVANDTVYIGAYDGAMYAFDLASGERRWKRRLGDAIGSSPVYHDGTVYIAVEYIPPDGRVFALDAATGEVRKSTEVPTDHPHSTIAVDLEAGKLVVGSNDGRLYCWSYPSLEPLWEFDTGEPIKGPVATDDGAAFFGSWDSRVYRVALEDGEQDWAYRTDGLVMSGPSVDTERGVVYVGSHDGNCYALDATSGERQWAFNTGGLVIGCPTVTAETVLVGTQAARLYALDRFEGRERWRVGVEGEVTSTPLVVGDGVYFAERATDAVDGKAYALGPA